MKVLVTGFDPFGSVKYNISGYLAELLDGHVVNNAQIVGHVLRTSFSYVKSELPLLVSSVNPNLVVMFGLDASSPYMKLETVARNRVNSILADNDGVDIKSSMIDPSGPSALYSSLNVSSICKNLRELNVECALSHNAGEFVCNYAYYIVLQLGYTAVFAHLPYGMSNPSLAATRVISLSLSDTETS